MPSVAIVGAGFGGIAAAIELRRHGFTLPRRNRAYPAVYRWLIRRVPGFQALRRRGWVWLGEALTGAIRHPPTLGRVWGTNWPGYMREYIDRTRVLDPGDFELVG
jgi:2-polyprenyl-6-methoxyphenol hydroxylase-like FAD-dependent oxidoreductase